MRKFIKLKDLSSTWYICELSVYPVYPELLSFDSDEV